jgi:hypothetical protein
MILSWSFCSPVSAPSKDSPPFARSAKQARRRLKGQVKPTKQKGGVHQNNRKNLQQIMMHGITMEERSTEVWSDAMPASKTHSTIRFVSRILVVSLDNGTTQSHMLWLSGFNKSSMMFLCLPNMD